MSLALNDVHSQLNLIHVADVVRPSSVEELQSAVALARQRGLKISVAGGRHAMGGQQFKTGALHIDMTALTNVLASDATLGHITLQAGAMWPAIISATHNMKTTDGQSCACTWAIRQKQTGVDEVTLGGSVSANAHGRGLMMQPIGGDIENLTIVNACGELVFCDRTNNAELFSLVIGGYGLFGLIYSITLRLSPRLRLRRMVNIIDIDDAIHAVRRRVSEGCIYGDFQFVIDGADDAFLRRGVFACYKPVQADDGIKEGASDLTPETWLKLLKLAHDDKKTAFKLYAQHYLATDGNCYWSDTMQLSTYIPRYAEFLESAREDVTAPRPKESLVIGEQYVPQDRLLEFINGAREILRQHDAELIYGTIRAISRDTVSYLPWARADFACVIFNLRTVHTAADIEKNATTFRALNDLCVSLGGSFFLTYHRYATAEQVLACYPNFETWLARKNHYDPDTLFDSDWHQHYRHEMRDSTGGREMRGYTSLNEMVDSTISRASSTHAQHA